MRMNIFRPGMRYLRGSLRVHALVSLGAIVALATFMVALGIGAFVSRTEQQSWQSRQRDAAGYAARSITDFIDQVQGFMLTVGLLDTDYLRQDNTVLYRLLRQNPALQEVVRLGYDGQVLATAYQDELPVLTNLFTIPQSNWFLEARQGQSYVGKVQIASNNQPYIIIAVPAADHGVVAARLNVIELWNLTASLKFGETGQVYVIDQFGQLIAHRQTDYVLASTNISTRPEIETILASPDHRWTDEYENFTGEQVLGSSQSIDEANWMVVAETNRSETFAATRRALILLAIVSLLFSLLLILAADSAMGRILFRPLAELRDGATRIGQGDLQHRIQANSHSEIGQLAVAFDEMAANLKQREDALAQARDAAQSASQFKSRLMANVSHDLRTPLNAILGYADILKEQIYGPLGEKQSNSVTRILANTQRLLDLVNSLLDQAQIEAGRLEWQITPFRPADLMAELQNVMGVLAQQKGLQLDISLAPDLPAIVKGDQRRIYQIVTNLVGNAVKFTERGWVRVAVEADGNFWRIRVSDSGPGIPPEELSHIFDPFHQVDNSTTRRQGGVGLGLSIVQQLCQLMGGSVKVNSELEQGSTFTVRLPVEQQVITEIIA